MNQSVTETINKETYNIDQKSTIEILKTINKEDKKIALALEEVLEEIAKLVDDIVCNIKKGGRIIYIGAGTSGRLGVLDASECPPTFSTDPNMVIGIIAGGDKALRLAIEGAEDNKELGVEDLKKREIQKEDVIIGIAASGNTPYVYGALEYAREEVGCVTAAISSNNNARIFEQSKYKILTDTKAEVISGSTRMKAGTAQKLVLNMITTSTMIKLGKVYNNLMIDVKASNKKLIKRSKYLIKEVLKCEEEKAEELFESSQHNVKIAIVMGSLKISYQEAKELLEKKEGFLNQII